MLEDGLAIRLQLLLCCRQALDALIEFGKQLFDLGDDFLLGTIARNGNFKSREVRTRKVWLSGSVVEFPNHVVSQWAHQIVKNVLRTKFRVRPDDNKRRSDSASDELVI